jgi:hypothetical protein
MQLTRLPQGNNQRKGGRPAAVPWPATDLDREVNIVQELEVCRLLTRRHHRPRQAHRAGAPQGVVARHHSSKRAWAARQAWVGRASGVY